jgi:ribosomal protein S18 acetylase RimI-like enzyme
VSSLDVTVRAMGEDDLPGVAEVEAGVFTDWYRTHRRETEALARRTPQELRYATSIEPGANFVAIAPDGALAGFIFARRWGSVAWFGTFGVPTQLQGLGVGKRLLDSAVARLRAGGAEVVGLETMPESGANMGLYARAGFVVCAPTIILELPLIREAARFGGRSGGVVWDAEDAWTRRRLLSGMRDVCDAVWPGLDCTREITAFREHGVGETLVRTGRAGRVDGFALLRTVSFRENDTSGRAYVHFLALRPDADAPAVLDGLLGQVWARATRVGFSSVYTGVNGQHHEAVRLLLERGLRAHRAAVRMVNRDAPAAAFLPQGTVYCSRWAG